MGERIRCGVGTLLGGVDGHVAMYLSNGGGTMGDWTSPGLTEANTRWLEVGATFRPQLQATPDPPLPGDGVTQFGTRYCQDDGDPKSQWHPHAREEPEPPCTGHGRMRRTQADQQSP